MIFQSLRIGAKGELKGDYILFINSGECISKTIDKNDILIDIEAYYLKVQDYEGSDKIVRKELRLLRRDILWLGAVMERAMCSKTSVLDVEINNVETADAHRKKAKAENMLKLLSKYARDEFFMDYGLGYYSLQVGELNMAKSYYDGAYKVMNMNANEDFYRDMAVALIAKGDNTEAVALLEEGIMDYDKYGELYYLLGISYRNSKEYDKALYYLNLSQEDRGKENSIYTEGYDTYKNFYIQGEIYEELEDYVKAAKYFTQAEKYKKDEESIVRACSNLKKSGFDNETIERYIKSNFELKGVTFIRMLAIVFRRIQQWKEAIKYGRLLSTVEGIEIVIEGLYHTKQYKECFWYVKDNYDKLDKKIFAPIALCSAILEGHIAAEWLWEISDKLAIDKFNDMVEVFNFFAYEKDYLGNAKLIEDFCVLLMDSCDGSCACYVRDALDRIKNLDYLKLAQTALQCNLYGLCEEIVNNYCRDYKQDYELVRLMSKLYYFLGNTSECEKYISCALSMQLSRELVKLLILCKLKQCDSMLEIYDRVEKITSFENTADYLKKAERCLRL